MGVGGETLPQRQKQELDARFLFLIFTTPWAIIHSGAPFDLM